MGRSALGLVLIPTIAAATDQPPRCFRNLPQSRERADGSIVRAVYPIHLLDDPSGDIDSLLARLDFVRTWSYVSYQSSWLDDPEGLQAKARGIEDRLSDALHERLVERFVERRRTTAHVVTASELQSPFVKLGELRRALFESSKATPDQWLNELIDAQDASFDLDDRAAVRRRQRDRTLSRGIEPAPEWSHTRRRDRRVGRTRLRAPGRFFSRRHAHLGGILPRSHPYLTPPAGLATSSARVSEL